MYYENRTRIYKVRLFILQDLKDLLSITKCEFQGLESQLQNDLKQLGIFWKYKNYQNCATTPPNSV